MKNKYILQNKNFRRIALFYKFETIFSNLTRQKPKQRSWIFLVASVFNLLYVDLAEVHGEN
jgi:hypothetical protein